MICSVKYGSDWVTGLFVAGVKSLNLSSSLAHNNLIVIKSSWDIACSKHGLPHMKEWTDVPFFHVPDGTSGCKYVLYSVRTLPHTDNASIDRIQFNRQVPSLITIMWLYSYNTITSSHPMPGLISAPWIRSSTLKLWISVLLNWCLHLAFDCGIVSNISKRS